MLHDDAIILDQSWKKQIAPEFDKPYMRRLSDFLEQERANGITVFPPAPDIFDAMNATPFDKVKVVILGQDPYHGAGQAHGLSFSVREGIRKPPSLKNIHKEIERSFGKAAPESGDLTTWARQGVLLLNATLTVREGAAGSHQKKGWEEFTDAMIAHLNNHTDHTVFLLWGSYAQKKGAMIDRARHLVLEAPHPSPLSAHRGFLGCNHFVEANNYLIAHGKDAVRWL